VAQFKVHEHLRSKLCDLYESDSIFDKFQCCLSDDGSHLATGSYGNTFRTFDTHAGGADTLEVTKTPQRLRTERMRAATGGSLSASPSLVSGLMGRASGRSSPSAFSQPVGPGSPDFQTKILHMAWHPQEHVLAAAASNSLYIFNA
jgi:serine/threonine-protein phosphatase 2A regulatory subunit B